ncbi:hypothetical protein ACFXA3_17305 [Streptomyces sp. NPDC059456]|uniref:hypothetical protein n=1 Tax=Streptomyces sp. NPDC059456 TaxID=3346838 RepID=UPI00367B1643
MFSQSVKGEGGSARSRGPRLGNWTYTPASTPWAVDDIGVLCHEGQDIDLHYSSTVFEDFLDAMSAIECDFTRRFHGTAPAEPSADERSGRNSRV